MARPGLLAKLIAQIRPEFRADTLVFSADDPVFGGGACGVADCPRSACGRGLCSGHFQRWVNEGRPDLDGFAATTDPRWRRQQRNAVCRVAACGYGTARGGMCQLHAQRVGTRRPTGSGRWLADPPPVRQPAPGSSCRIAHCQLWPHASNPFCHSHHATWRANGRPNIEEFAARFTNVPTRDEEIIRLDRLNTQLRLEIQYALQCRHDEQRTKTAPIVVMKVVRFLAGTGVLSLLDRTENNWREQIGRPAPKDSNPRALLTYLTLRFDGIAQPWLRELAKRWVRWRLAGGLGLQAAAGRPVRVLTPFSRFTAAAGIAEICELDRVVLERHLADLHAEMAGTQRHGVQAGLPNAFFAAIRQHGWDASLPATATFFAEDFPKRGEGLPRALAEHVMTQVEHREHLTRWDNRPTGWSPSS